jgi:TP901 family phage tail tape measure protein
MSTAAPIAAALGVSVEETAAAIGKMSDAGIQGERAGTALRGIFASLAGPTTQAQEALAKYGLTAADIDPQVVGLTAAMAVLQERGISTADAMTIFGR